jgi:hypothetical protein
VGVGAILPSCRRCCHQAVSTHSPPCEQRLAAAGAGAGSLSVAGARGEGGGGAGAGLDIGPVGVA